MSIRNYTNTGQTSTLVAAIGATDTSFTLNNYAGDPTPPFTAALARGTATEEVILVTAVNVNTVAVTRGYDGTQAQAQGAGTTFQEVVVALDYREANQHVNATTAVHGLAAGSAVVGTTDTQSLSNKTLLVATLTAPTLTGTANGANLALTGTLTVGGAITLSGATTLAGGASVPTGVKLTLTDAPTTGTHAANKAYVDSTVGGATGSSSAATPSKLVIRDGAGRAQFVDPTVAADAATKNYVDTAVAPLAAVPKFYVQTTDPAGSGTVANGSVWFQTS